MDVSQRQDRSTHRAHTSLPKINTANRSNTTNDIPSATESPKHQHRHLTRRHHRHHHTRDTIQSAIQLQHPFSFDSYNPLKRSHHQNPSNTADSTTRQAPGTDGHPQQQQPPEHQLSLQVQNADVPKKRLIKAEDVTRERNRRERRQEDVSEALNALSRDAHTATRKLDDTYYSLLEKLVSLKATLASLQQLSTQAKSSKDEFGQDAEALRREVKGQIDGFGGYKTQEKNVDDLVSRLKYGKEKAAGLEARLETCRGRLEKWERKEQEQRKLSNRRWALTWAGLALVLAIVITVLVWRKSRHQKGLYEVIKEQGENLPDLGFKHLLKNKTAKPGLHLTDAKLAKQQAEEEERWRRLLDEL